MADVARWAWKNWFLTAATGAVAGTVAVACSTQTDSCAALVEISDASSDAKKEAGDDAGTDAKADAATPALDGGDAGD